MQLAGKLRLRSAVIVAPVLATVALSCAHRGSAPKPPLSPAAERLVHHATTIETPRYEEAFLEARLVYQALPPYQAERRELRAKLLAYLLGPIEDFDARSIEASSSGLVASELDTKVLSALQDAAGLFSPEELWAGDGKSPPPLDPAETRLLAHAARVVKDLYGPRSGEAEVALATSILTSLEPTNPAWPAETERILAWAEEGHQLAAGTSQLEGPPISTAVLESVLERWPSPAVAGRLAKLYLERRDRLTALLRRPLGGGNRAQMFGSLGLEQGEGLPTTTFSMVTLYLRCGRIDLANAAGTQVAERPGDDPELRALVKGAADPPKPSPEAFAALARRFLPRVPLLAGTSTDRMDPLSAHRVLELGLRYHPQDAGLLVLASRVARLAGAPLLSFRHLDEAESMLGAQGATKEDRVAHSKELVDLAYGLLRVRMDPENPEPAIAYAENLRRRLAEGRSRFGTDADWLSEQRLDLELARNFIDAGQADRSEPVLEKALERGAAGTEVELQMANLLLKRGDPGRALRLLQESIDRHKPENPPNETIGYVEMHAKLTGALGQAQEQSGQSEEAEKAYRAAATGWERLRIEFLRRRNRDQASEATTEVGRLLYLLGRREEGIQKFLEAIELSDGRDQSYIDPLAFLVQRGEIDAALDIYRRAVSRSGDSVSEYVKVYASLWIQDLARRAGRPPEPSAEAFLAFVARRKIHLRPVRASLWYVPLARYAIGQMSYADMQALATTAGRKAELYFYEAMRRLAAGQRDDAHDLWTLVIGTKMFSFFEFDMASRYLRVGAPSGPPTRNVEAAETI
jgi:tetratricopeptide (TPR) repeat protein